MEKVAFDESGPKRWQGKRTESYPTWRLSAVGSNPTYTPPVVGKRGKSNVASFNCPRLDYRGMPGHQNHNEHFEFTQHPVHTFVHKNEPTNAAANLGAEAARQ